MEAKVQSNKGPEIDLGKLLHDFKGCIYAIESAFRTLEAGTKDDQAVTLHHNSVKRIKEIAEAFKRINRE